MRKLVIDGSNTSGFQRTALVAFNGALPDGGQIETICLEEEAAQRVKDEVFHSTGSDPARRDHHVAGHAYTGGCPEGSRVYRHGPAFHREGEAGLGTIRQDVNISIARGARVEIKACRNSTSSPRLVRREVQRQQSLLAIRDELKLRGASADTTAGPRSPRSLRIQNPRC